MPAASLASAGPVPLTIISGFLGAGKTTFLNNFLNAPHGLRIAVLVNDFGAINIDTQLIANIDADAQAINLSNGCICCTIRGDLLSAVLGLLDRPEHPEYIIVECSGVSDPLPVAETFLNPALQQWVAVDGIVTVVDAEQLPHYKDGSATLAEEQIAVADVIVLNKVDLVPPADLAESKKAWLPPRARVIETNFARVPLELVIGVGRYDPARLNRAARAVHVHEAGVAAGHDGEVHAGHHDHGVVFDSWSWTTTEAVSLNAVKRVVGRLPPSIFRCKGILFLAAARIGGESCKWWAGACGLCWASHGAISRRGHRLCASARPAASMKNTCGANLRKRSPGMQNQSRKSCMRLRNGGAHDAPELPRCALPVGVSRPDRIARSGFANTPMQSPADRGYCWVYAISS